MRTAIVYDRVNKWGGAERVLLVLHEMFPEAPLFTSVYEPKEASWAKVFPEVIPSFLQRVPLVKTRHERLAALMPLTFEGHNFSDFDLVISVTSEAAKGIVTLPETKHVCVCLTPTRYLWSGYGDYFGSLVKRSAAEPVVRYLRWWDKVAAQRPDVMMAISTEVRERIRKYYKRDSVLVFPPVGLDRKNSLLRGPRLRESAIRSFFDDPNRDYYLVVSRLVKYKKVELVIDAFNEMEERLVVVGSGKEEEKLRRRAKENVELVGNVSEEGLWRYYANCRALVAPQREDFGLVMVEAMSLGKPVVAFRGGGALDIVEEGKNGVFFDRQTKVDIMRAIQKMSDLTFDSKYIKNSTKRFSEERFKKELKRIVKEL